MINFIAIDFEKANEKSESICALGIVVVENGNIAEEKSWLFRPTEMRFTRENTNRHEIFRCHVEDKESFHDLWPELSGYFTKHVLVAHGAATADMSYLRSVLAHYAIEPPEFHYVCTCAMARAAWPDNPGGYELPKVAEHLGITFEHHKPKEDARVCSLAVLRACHERQADSIEDLATKLSIDLVPFTMTRPRRGRSSSSSGSSDVGIVLYEWDTIDDDEEEMEGKPVEPFSDEDIKRHCRDSGVFDRGKKYMQQGKVNVTRRGSTSWSAEVAGRDKTPYDVTVDRLLQGTCRCPAWKRKDSKRFCKHTVALALVWAAEGGPPALETLSDDDKREAMAATISALRDADCRRLLLKLAKENPDTIYQLLSGSNTEEN